MKGRIFNIQRYSIQDGPGIRTTVFLKGCPLRCPWCANPESWAVRPELFYTRSKCIHCFTCVHEAKHQEITRSGDELVFDRSLCTGETAFKLSDVCPSGALSVKYKETDRRELMEAIEKDLPFYEKSGGGVTFSGGEPLLQAEFLSGVLDDCREKGIHTAIETTGCVQWDVFEMLKGKVDLYLYDVKHIDGSVHKAYTGADNKEILDNLEKLSARGDNIHVRVPVIPGFNDDPRTLKQIGMLLDRLGIRKRTLLAFHQYGSSKFKALGIDYAMEGAAQMDDERLNRLADASGFYGQRRQQL